MWSPEIIEYDELIDFDPIGFVTGSKSALIIRNFYCKKDCEILANRVASKPHLISQGNIKTIGPFLMSYATKKEKYFEQSCHHDEIFLELFSNLVNPAAKIKNFLGKIFPKFSFEFASENGMKYSKCIIRIHEKNDYAPIHKDNVSYEGINYLISKIDFQISCVLHLQASEQGGEVIIYKKKWEKSDETHRKIDFGYDDMFLDGVEKSIITPQKGDLVIINPNYFHGVARVFGETKRITLGMFCGFYASNSKAVLWA